MRSVLLLALWTGLAGVLAGCATTGTQNTARLEKGSTQDFAGGSYFSGISALHSELNLKLKLALAADGRLCRAEECLAHREFDQRIARIGDRLSLAAFVRYPELRSRFDRFLFVVAEKKNYGTASSDAGTVVVLRGVDRLGMDDSALAFVMAREMAHVIVGHHEENAITSVVFSLAAQVLMPMLNVARGAAAIVASKSASSAVASAAAMAGSQAVQASQRPEQLQQAEGLSLELLTAAGYGAQQTVESLQVQMAGFPSGDDWIIELRGSIERMAKLAALPAPDAEPYVPMGLAPASVISGSDSFEFSRDMIETQALIEAGADPSRITPAPATGFKVDAEAVVVRGTEAGHVAGEGTGEANLPASSLRAPRLPAWLRKGAAWTTQAVGLAP